MRKGQLFKEAEGEEETVIGTLKVESEFPLNWLGPVMFTAGGSEVDEDMVAPTTSGGRSITVKEWKRRRQACNRDEVPRGGWLPVGSAGGFAGPEGQKYYS